MLDTPQRQRNEKTFGEWEELLTGGRRYRYEVKGRFGWTAKYVKEVDADERTVRFWQEIYDDAGALQEVHQKFPEDLGHQKVGR